MSAIEQLFEQLRSQNQKAFMPFVTAGDPNLEVTAQVLERLGAADCHLAELGIPYSDPIADGPVIQASYTRALQQGVGLESIFETVAEVTPRLPMPLVAMVSYAIIYRQGPETFLQRAQEAGFAGAIVPDLPVDESAELAELCRSRDFSLIPLVTPTTSPERAAAIAKRATGFIYYVSIAGITGERTELPADLIENLQSLRQHTDLPICVGFGISRPEQVAQLKPHCDGVIVGSAVVRRLAAMTAGDDPSQVLDEVESFVRSMVEALGDADA